MLPRTCNRLFNTYITKRRAKKDKSIEKIIKVIKSKTMDSTYLELFDTHPPILPPRNNVPTQSELYSDSATNTPKQKLTIQDAEVETTPIFSRVYPSLTQVAVATLAIQGISSGVYGCDQTLFLNSNGKVCDKTDCQNIITYSFNLSPGRIICFRSSDNQIMSFEMADANLNYRYLLQYYTSTYDLDVTSVSNCKQAGLCYKEHCYEGAHHDIFVSKNVTEGFSCDTEGLGCEDMCFHKYACTWYHWWISKVGTLVPVYLKSVSYWEFHLKVKFGNITSLKRFTTSTPTSDLISSQLFLKSNLPITVSSVMSETNHLLNHVIVDNNTVYEVSASDTNLPQSNKIGDLQISLSKIDMKIPNNDIRCKVYGCKAFCTTPEPALRAFRSTKKTKYYHRYSIVDNNQIEVKIPTFMTGTINIGNVEFNHLFVEPSSCKINVIKTYGCTGCNKLPYAVMQATQIINPGVLKYDSNCTFNMPYLSCSPDYYIIVPTQHYSTCELYIPKTNITILLNFEYEFVGELSIYQTKVVESMTWSDMAVALSTNSNFIDTFTYGLVAMSGLGLVLNFGLKAIGKFFAARELAKAQAAECKD
nr:GP [Wugcerasp virus 8]